MQKKETPSLSSSSRHLGAILRPRMSKVTAPKHFLLDDHHNKPLRFSKTPQNLNFIHSFDDVRNTTRFSNTQRVLQTSPDVTFSPLTRTQTFGRKSLMASPIIGPHLDHRRYEADPRLKTWGTAISKKGGDTTDVLPDEESDSPSPYYDLKIPAVSCKDCQIVRQKRLSTNQRGVEKMEFLYCTKHLSQFQVQRKYLSISAESDIYNDKEKEFTKPENRARFESFRRTLFTEEEPQPHPPLQDYKITPIKTSLGGHENHHTPESDKLDTILQQLNSLKASLQGNYLSLEDLFIKQIKKFLLENLALYTDLRQKIKVELEEETPRLGGQFSSSKRNARNWDEIDFKTFALKKECEDLLKIIDTRPWEVLNLTGDFDKLMRELQGGSFAGSDQSNRGNVRRVLELSKDMQSMKQQESDLKKELEEAKARINKLEAEILVQGSFDKLNKQRLEELSKELESKNNSNSYLEKEARDMKAKLLDPKTLIKEHLELTVRELAVLLSNGEAKELSEEAKNLLQKALPNQQENNEKMNEIIKKLFEQNQDMNGELELQQAENAALSTQVYQLKEMLAKEAKSRGSAGRNTSRREGAAFPRSFESSFSNIPDAHHDMATIKARMMENTDFLMMLHLQGLSLEDHIYKNESLNKILEYTISSQQKKEENNNTHVPPPKIVKKFSFFDQ